MFLNKHFHNGNLYIYLIYIFIACAVTAGLNIVHTKYILGIDLYTALFIVPTIAGIIFGYLTAKIRITSNLIAYHADILTYVKYVSFSCFITSALNVAHTEWVLDRQLTTQLFIAPLVAGVFFGYLLARIKTLNNRLIQLATTDILTDTYNRMQFELYLKQEIEKGKRYGSQFALIYFDIDNFKSINDQYGHQTGDQILISLASVIKSNNRSSDIFARYGGDEFIILTPSSDKHNALAHAHKLNSEVARYSFGIDEQITCSFGVVEYRGEQDQLTDLLKTVDKALYDAKHSGKNQVVSN